VIRLFLSGDVMTGRGIDQILAHPCDPQIREEYCKSALDYITLAERVSGPIKSPVGFD
jgi:poly-gamma-glutamate capsule biosynthesis protein CapA/YwtB (metallophosphatase superfamily)